LSDIETSLLRVRQKHSCPLPRAGQLDFLRRGQAGGCSASARRPSLRLSSCLFSDTWRLISPARPMPRVRCHGPPGPSIYPYVIRRPLLDLFRRSEPRLSIFHARRAVSRVPFCFSWSWPDRVSAPPVQPLQLTQNVF